MKLNYRMIFPASFAISTGLSSVATAAQLLKSDGSTVEGKKAGNGTYYTPGSFNGNGTLKSSGTTELSGISRELSIMPSDMIDNKELTELKGSAAGIVTALVAVAFVLLIGRAIIRALQIRP